MSKVKNISRPGGIIKHGRRCPKSNKYPEKNKKYARPRPTPPKDYTTGESYNYTLQAFKQTGKSSVESLVERFA